jgi:hypothetical protein
VKLDVLQPGMTVGWIHNPRGGYGFAVPVDAVIVRVGPRRVRIRVALKDGRQVERVVSPESLRSRYL